MPLDAREPLHAAQVTAQQECVFQVLPTAVLSVCHFYSVIHVAVSMLAACSHPLLAECIKGLPCRTSIPCCVHCFCALLTCLHLHLTTFTACGPVSSRKLVHHCRWLDASYEARTMHLMEPSSLNKHALGDRNMALHHDLCTLMMAPSRLS